METPGLQGDEASGALRLQACDLRRLKTQGPHQQRREAISLDRAMNSHTWDDWLHCFLQSAVVLQYTYSLHTSW